MFARYAARNYGEDDAAWKLERKYLLFDMMHATIRLAGSFFTHLIRVAHNFNRSAIGKIVTALRSQGVDVKDCDGGRKSINVTFSQAAFILDTVDSWLKIVIDGAKLTSDGINQLVDKKFGFVTKSVWVILKVTGAVDRSLRYTNSRAHRR